MMHATRGRTSIPKIFCSLERLAATKAATMRIARRDLFMIKQQIHGTAPKYPMAKLSIYGQIAVNFRQRLHAVCSRDRNLQAGCCQKPNFKDSWPFLSWLWDTNPGSGLLGFSSAPKSCWFEVLNCFVSVLLTFPALACDLLISNLSAICSATFEILLNKPNHRLPFLSWLWESNPAAVYSAFHSHQHRHVGLKH